MKICGSRGIGHAVQSGDRTGIVVLHVKVIEIRSQCMNQREIGSSSSTVDFVADLHVESFGCRTNQEGAPESCLELLCCSDHVLDSWSNRIPEIGVARI